MNYKPNEAEIKNLIWLLMHGGDIQKIEWRRWRESDCRLVGTDLRRHGLIEIDSERVRITEAGRKAVKEIS